MDVDTEGPNEAVRLMELRAAAILHRQRMPSDEFRAVLSAGDPAIVRRYLELHRERLEEWFEGQRRALESVEGWLVARSVAPIGQMPRPKSYRRPCTRASTPARSGN
jgi:hypothetical protein